MRFPEMGRNRQYRVSVPQLDGGVNYTVPPHMINDNQLSDVLNMWYRDGSLRTRPGLREVGGNYDSSAGAWYDHVRRVGDKLLLYSVGTMGIYPWFATCWVDETGEIADDSGVSHLFTDKVEGVSVVSLIPIPVNAGASESLSLFDVVLMVGLNDGTGVLFGYGQNEDDQTYFLRELEPYIPTVLMNGTPQDTTENVSVSGDLLEPYNILTPFYKCQYTSNKTGIYYFLPETGAIAGETVTVTYTDPEGFTWEHTADYIEDYNDGFVISILYEETGEDVGDGLRLKYFPEKGYFYFYSITTNEGVALPASAITNNVEITVGKRRQEHTGKIYNMRFCTWFGGGSSGLSGGTRLFVSGNPEHQNLVHWSSLNNPLYFPENNYAYVGDDSKAVTAFGKQGELLVIFKDGEVYCTQYQQGYTVTAEDVQSQRVIDTEAARAVFPMLQLHPELGCDCPNTIQLCNNRLVWLNSDGRVYGLFTTGQYNERNVRMLSLAVDKKLRTYTQEQLKAASAAELYDNYLLMIGSTIYVMDYSSYGFAYSSSYSSDEKAQKAIQWYLWDLSGCGVFDNTNQLPVLSTAGGHPLLVAPSINDVTVLLAFEEGQPDNYQYMDVDHNETILTGERPIQSMFATRLFDFGYPERFKRLNPFYLQITGDGGETLNLTYLNGKGSVADVYAPVLPGGSPEEAAPMRITPNVIRERLFGIRVECTGRIAVGGMLLNYSMMGAVR